jgi:hypothetical protein
MCRDLGRHGLGSFLVRAVDQIPPQDEVAELTGYKCAVQRAHPGVEKLILFATGRRTVTVEGQGRSAWPFAQYGDALSDGRL